MSTTTPTNDFLLRAAKKQLGFKSAVQVSLSDVDTIAPHQRYLSERPMLMTSLPLFNPPLPPFPTDVDRIGWCLESILKN